MAISDSTEIGELVESMGEPDALVIAGVDIEEESSPKSTPIDELLGFVGRANIADHIRDRSDGEARLLRIACKICEDASRDRDSMTDWVNDIEDGREVAKQEAHGKSSPWEGASNFKTPDMIEACTNFGDRASTELLRTRNIIKTDVIGRPSPEKKSKSENVSEYMNWQINYEMADDSCNWRDGQESLLYELPSTGTVFKEIYFDSVEKVNRSDLIHYPDFYVNQAADDKSPFTQVMSVPYCDVISNQRAGIWSDVEIYPPNDTDEQSADTGSNAEQDAKVPEDNPERFYRQRCWFDLDDDGYAEPYIITVHERSKAVVSITPRFYASNIYVSNAQGETGLVEAIKDPVNVVRIKPNKDLVKYEFLKPADGTYLARGYLHMLTSISKAVNTTTNLLMDSGVLANLQGGYLAKGFRKRMGNTKMKPGSWIETDISANDLHNGVKPHMFKEPSMTLYQLREMLSKELKDLTVNMDLQGVMAPNAPATTTLALIAESSVPASAIMKRIINAESKEFKCFFQLNSIYADPKEYKQVLDNPEANYASDFDIKSMDIMPTASAEMSSKIQRMQQANVMIGEAPNIAMSGGDVRPLYENWFDAIGADYMVNQVWPDPESMDESQKQRMQEMQEQQRKEQMLLGIDIDHKERELELKEQLGRADLILKQAELQKSLMDLRKTESEIILNLEKAESEQVKNQIDMYTASLAGVRQAIESTIKEIEVINAPRNAEQAGTVSAEQPSSQRGLPRMAQQPNYTAT